MPFVSVSSYVPPHFLHNGHTLTLWASQWRDLNLPWEPFFETVRLDTPDGDFFDVDVLPSQPDTRSDCAIILSHGLEGNSRRPYMRGMAEAFRQSGWDALARNFRGCSGEPNRTLGMYHGGETGDLHLLVEYAISLGYRKIALIGFSMGGNQTLKYLGENPSLVPREVCAGVGISVPCDMEGSARVLDQPSRLPYMIYFMTTLRDKMREKHARFPDRVSVEGLSTMLTFRAFDDAYTAPFYGFKNAHDYWRRSSSLSVLGNIRIPSYLLNAADDPFLSRECYPVELAKKSRLFTLEVPRHGGHVGFVGPDPSRYWSETRTLAFVLAIAESGLTSFPALIKNET